jgi:hypothetical protein
MEYQSSPRYKPQWHYMEPKDLVPKPDVSKMKMKPQHYPRNMLEVNLPTARL